METMSLAGKVRCVLNDLIERRKIDEQCVKPINTAISSPNSVISLDTFHAYVHNKKSS